MVTWPLTMKKFQPNAMSGQHCENYDVKWETVHCYPRNVNRCCTWSEVESLNDWSLEKQWILFPDGISMFPSTSSRETLRFSGNKIHCSPQDQPLSVNYNPSNILLARDWSKRITRPNIPQLYTNRINARALIGQSAMVYCASKPMEKSRVFWIIL